MKKWKKATITTIRADQIATYIKVAAWSDNCHYANYR